MRCCPFFLGAAGAACVLTSVAPAAEKVVATVSGPDFDVSGGQVVQQINFNAADSISGVGFTAQWTAVVADEEDGFFPWSLDLEIDITAPGGAMLHWAPIGGDRTIADYPLAAGNVMD